MTGGSGDVDDQGGEIYGGLSMVAFTALYRTHRPAVTRYCAARVPGVAVEDLVADVFAQAWACRSSFDPERGPASGWALGIAANVVRQHYRKEERRQRAPARNAAQELPGQRIDLDEDAVIEELQSARRFPAVAEAMATMTDTERHVLALGAEPDLSYGAISDILGVPVGTVRSKMSRARAKLRTRCPASVNP